jgi:chromosome segregation ATPase
MKYIVLIACLFAHPAWSQTKTSTQSTAIQALQNKREALSVSIKKMRADVSDLLYRQEEADKTFFENLTSLDSLEGKRLQLKEVTRPSAGQKKQIDEIVRRGGSIKNHLSGMELRRQTLKDRYNTLLFSLDKNVSQLQQLDEEIARRSKK